ncbi:piggyBac transposable element-derived protein 4 [Trichonephila clavata]|uniref:PiggyBac transposable element-derived protein 4 n=1 Tax=Trichonephila clavata TaxID=2740835 RepID=A0A8X6J3Y1_TRICU|nr:piggyBac transposable element-derived protein 4 [Trichonephila clavata]
MDYFTNSTTGNYHLRIHQVGISTQMPSKYRTTPDDNERKEGSDKKKGTHGEKFGDEEFSSSESESDDDWLDCARDWCEIDVNSPLPSHPKFTFTGNPGIKVCLGDSGEPLEYFNLFFDDEMFSFIVEETNRYDESFFENTELTPASRALK